MTKTGKQIQGDIYRLLRDSALSQNISGKVYRRGKRPRDSKAEDAVVIFTTADAEQIQTGVVTINIFVPDYDFDNNGVLSEDTKRTEELEILAQSWVESLTADRSCYKFSLQRAITTDSDETIHQHFVVIPLRFALFDDEPRQALTTPQNPDNGGSSAVEPVIS